jgi:CheY-like chemotaxis protein/HPt (histidine-containing phosphotransfer) domain-containing protein
LLDSDRTTFRVSLPIETVTLGPRTGSESKNLCPSTHAASRVLLAEDNPVNREVLTKLLQFLGFTVETAIHGEEALQRLSRSFDLILLDCHMPVMNGFEASRRIRALGTQTPILALTADITDETRLKIAQSGMNGRILKPVTLQTLSEALQQWVPGAPALDPTYVGQLRQIAGGNPEFLDELRSTFLEHSEKLLDEIDAGLKTQDTARIRRAAHSLKSSSGALGASNLAGLCQELENSDGVERSAPVARAIRGVWSHVRDEVARL